MEIKKIFVAGAGLMGGGIAQICAQKGYDVTIRDISQDFVDKGVAKVQWSVEKLVSKGKVPGTVDEIMGRIHGVTDVEAANGADFVFEAIIENLEAKKELFAQLDKVCPDHAIFASNTSAIPITNIAEATQRPEQFCGTHFFSPVPLMKIVEIIRGLMTSDETMDTAEALCQDIGKETIRVNMDVAGFALNRINFPSTIEAIRLVEAGVVSVADVDKGMRLGFGRAMGPLETADMAGLDIGFNAYNAVYEETKNEKFCPPMLLQRKVKIGHLGRKTGIGWYIYDQEGKKIGPAPLMHDRKKK
ncbi:MAG: 3-hydroxyacyl-CoA dehydrogenase family protein [Desulfarculaceae bacterium]|nr:3-hydroxyacyl-CoA dehydrogenase family protein [Desulfarculaceae bacterium]MCF8073143.1 3-hydroxyacyl-CoA dehydrogenase family protein [Desulfarculaceae bacterium]MCF8101772.1 3-hydroxyacyl-CoA dehydrogenase family protein [Desulfarculaceae bacterium]MCF8118390.1 3-hydroxyacyl-CoA dehydrogenase family protein [Desulfarculaceae bacterium]